MSLSTSQLTDRRAALTASEFAAVLGLSPFASPTSLWCEKVGKTPPRAGTERTRRGEAMEALVRADYEERHGVTVERADTMLRPYGDLLVAATPDGLRVSGRRKGLEIKTHSVHNVHEYGRPGTDEVPIHEAIQCQICMWVTGCEAWDLVLCVDHVDREYTLRRDDALIATSLEHGASWWRRHVVAHVMPEPDGSAATESAIRAILPGTVRPMKEAQWAAPSPAELAALKSSRAALVAAKRDFAAKRQAVEALIGDADGWEWTDGDKKLRVSWRTSRDSSVVDYEAALVDWRNSLELFAGIPCDADAMDALRAAIRNGPDLKRYTTPVPGSRRFIVPREWGDDES